MLCGEKSRQSDLERTSEDCLLGMAQGLCSGRIPIEWSYVRAAVDLVGELLFEAVRLIRELCRLQVQVQVRVADLGPDKIRDRPQAAATLLLLLLLLPPRWADGRAGRVGGAAETVWGRRSLEGGSCSGMGLSWAGPGGLENGPGLNAAGLQCYPQCVHLAVCHLQCPGALALRLSRGRWLLGRQQATA